MKIIRLQKAAGVSAIIFPIMLLAGFVMHPDLLRIEITDSVDALVANFYRHPLFHWGHLIVFFSVFPIIITLCYLMLLENKNNYGSGLVFWGGLIGVLGAVILAADKGALCLVLSAFDSLSYSEIIQITPALEAILHRKGMLVLFYALPLLPVGSAIQISGLIKGGEVSKLAGISGIIGLLLLNNPDIEIISSIGAVLMCFYYVPLGLKIYKGEIS